MLSIIGRYWRAACSHASSAPASNWPAPAETLFSTWGRIAASAARISGCFLVDNFSIGAAPAGQRFPVPPFNLLDKRFDLLRGTGKGKESLHRLKVLVILHR